MADQTAYYNTRYQFDPRRSVVWKCICKWLEREIPGDSVVLEIGAGYCDFINNIKAKRKIALDLSDTLSERALPEVETHVGSCANLQFAADSSVDVVFASNLLEHLTMPQIEQTLSETLRVLKSGGKLVIIQPNFAYCSKVYFDDYTHIGIFTHRALADLFEASRLQGLPPNLCRFP